MMPLLSPRRAPAGPASVMRVAALVAEARPYAEHPSALVLVDRTTDWSFPSDHW